ncbi:hypothetical protein J6590_030747 [Homalodisca vitripennis]|nr:hypothetical protein J6590_030747 [Homalodisca vitripennis]
MRQDIFWTPMGNGRQKTPQGPTEGMLEIARPLESICRMGGSASETVFSWLPSASRRGMERAGLELDECDKKRVVLTRAPLPSAAQPGPYLESKWEENELCAPLCVVVEKQLHFGNWKH